MKKLALHDRTGRLEIFIIAQSTSPILHDRTGRLENPINQKQ